jgi:hypothetical protein
MTQYRVRMSKALFSWVDGGGRLKWLIALAQADTN